MSGPKHNDREDWEDDPVWNLVDAAKRPEAGPFFVRSVMREIRLASVPSPRWWQRLLAPKPILAGALGAAAAVALLVQLNSGTPAQPGLSQTPPAGDPPPAVDSPAPEPSPLDELLKEEMLFSAAENPAAFTDEALLELLD